MKALPIAVAFAVIAVPLFASADDNQATKSSTSTKTLGSAPGQSNDSPLVRAAKASAKGKKPTIVITNETLIKSGGHITTASAPAALPAAPPAAPVNPQTTAAAVYKKHVAQVEKAKKAEEAKKAAAAAHAAADLYGDTVEPVSPDPSVQEHVVAGSATQSTASTQAAQTTNSTQPTQTQPATSTPQSSQNTKPPV